MIYMFEISERKYVKQSILANTKNLHVYLYLSFNFKRILKTFKIFKRISFTILIMIIILDCIESKILIHRF